MLHQYRVTKYDPSRRSISGSYPVDDWTSRSDVGKTFEGEVLTEERYLCVEEAYLAAAMAFLDEADIRELRVVGLESEGGSCLAPSDGSTLSSPELSTVLRSLLREEYWCKLESPLGFIHVGWDYYMYIGVPHRCSSAEVAARLLGLFPEVFKSPYFTPAA